jgi:hypothetical protein
MAMTEWNFYQISATGVEEPDLDAQTRVGVFNPIRRPVDMKICNFGALAIGPRQSSDYTRTELYFQNKDELADWTVITADDGPGGRLGLRGTVVDNNPYVWGSTVKKVRDDQFFRMNMDNNLAGVGIEKPKFDVSDTDVVQIPVAGKKYPSEGWRSFGGKYDFLPYDGTLR